jgi:hypothetical protein
MSCTVTYEAQGRCSADETNFIDVAMQLIDRTVAGNDMPATRLAIAAGHSKTRDGGVLLPWPARHTTVSSAHCPSWLHDKSSCIAARGSPPAR